MRKTIRPRLFRYRYILERIREGLPGGSLPSASMMAGELGVSWHTIHRDLNGLRDDEGAPIEYDASRKGYYLAERGWSLGPVSLHPREVFAFSVAARMLQPFVGTPLEMDLQSVFAKIARSLEGTVTLSADALTERMTVLTDDYVPLHRDTWVRLAGHIERREALRIRYRTFRGEPRSFAVSPVHLVAYHGNWYVVVFEEGREGPLTLALSRIRSMRVLKRRGWAPREFDPAAYFESAFGLSRGAMELKVHLRVSPKIATYVGERVWHPSQRMTRRRDGSLDLRLETRGWKELVRWVLSWQPDVQVIAPRELGEHIKRKLREGLRENGESLDAK